MFPSSLSHNPALSLPSPSVQNQIHELAKTLPPPRKQNIACDACRCAMIYLLASSMFHPLTPPTPTRQAEESKVPSAAWTTESVSSLSFITPYAQLTVPVPFPVPGIPLPRYPVSQINPHFYAQHCMVKNYPCTSVRRVFSPLVVELTIALFRHHAQQATSEKKRISTVSRRPRAYTANTQQRSVLPLSLPHAAILFVFASK